MIKAFEERIKYMKKIFTFILAFTLCMGITLSVGAKPVAMAAQTCALVGNATIRAGEELKLTFSISGTGLLGIEALLEYDKSILTLTGNAESGNLLKNKDWMVEGDPKIMAYDNNQNNPINSNTAVFTLTFRVNNNVETGTEINVRLTGIEATDGKTGIKYQDAVYSTKVAAPKSGNANIGSLSIKNATLNEAFDPEVTTYTATMPFSSTALELVIALADAKSKYNVLDNSDLTVGENVVRIKVTAESGATKEYIITVTREQDPNYKPSDNANLSSITLSVGILSPRFNTEVTEYIVYLPYETVNITLSGTPENEKATVDINSYTLEEGNNICKVVCTAEDGATKKEYIVNVFRMKIFEGEIPVIGGTTPTPPPTDDPIETPTPPPTDDPIETPPPTEEPIETPEPIPSAEPTKEPTVTTTPSPTPSGTATASPTGTPEPNEGEQKTGLLTILVICISVIVICITLIVLYIVFIKKKIYR